MLVLYMFLPEMFKFFTALNPTSKNAALEVKAKVLNVTTTVPINDFTFYESLQDKIDCFSKLKRGFWVDYIVNTFHMMSLIGGAHHPVLDAHIVSRAVARHTQSTIAQEERESEIGSKGLLDFLIFPLLARKLIVDTYLKAREDAYLLNTLSWIIALPLEIIRDVMVISLTALMALTLVPLITIRQQFVAPPESDLSKNKGRELDTTQTNLAQDLGKAWDEKGDPEAAKQVRAITP